VDLENFYEYVLAFYGDNTEAIYDYKFTRQEVEQATLEHIESGDVPFDADSVDREIVRDIVLANRRLKNLQYA
jgi:hypothetical protein